MTRIVMGHSFDVADAAAGEMAAHPVGGYVVSAEYAEDNAETLAAFRRALRKAAQYANDRPDAVRESLPKFANVDADVADRVVINTFVAATPIGPGLQRIADAMHAHGMVAEPVDVSGFLLTGD